MLISLVPPYQLTVEHVDFTVFITGIDIFQPAVITLRMIQIFREAVPAGFLSIRQMRDDHAADKQAFPQLKQSRQLLHIGDMNTVTQAEQPLNFSVSQLASRIR